jgi:hypothetical protein
MHRQQLPLGQVRLRRLYRAAGFQVILRGSAPAAPLPGSCGALFPRLALAAWQQRLVIAAGALVCSLGSGNDICSRPARRRPAGFGEV